MTQAFLVFMPVLVRIPDTMEQRFSNTIASLIGPGCVKSRIQKDRWG